MTLSGSSLMMLVNAGDLLMPDPD